VPCRWSTPPSAPQEFARIHLQSHSASRKGRLLPFSGGRLASSPKSFGNDFVCQPGTWFLGKDGRQHRKLLDNAGTSAANGRSTKEDTATEERADKDGSNPCRQGKNNAAEFPAKQQEALKG
jgi:hypothetical protein